MSSENITDIDLSLGVSFSLPDDYYSPMLSHIPYFVRQKYVCGSNHHKSLSSSDLEDESSKAGSRDEFYDELAERTCAELQFRLWMGLVLEIFNILLPGQVTEEHFLRESDNQRYFTTSRLGELVIFWVVKELKADQETKLRNLQAINSVIWPAQQYINELLSPIDQDGFDSDITIENNTSEPNPLMFYQILLFASLLGETLCNVVRHIYLGGETYGVYWEHKIHKRLMLRNGWCRSDVERVFSELEMTTLRVYYLSKHLKDPRGQMINHSRCTSSQYSADFIDSDTYTTQHFEKLCKPSCSFLSAQEEGKNMVVDALRNDTIPLIKLQYSDGRPFIEVLQSDPDKSSSVVLSNTSIPGPFVIPSGSDANTPPPPTLTRIKYVAISHVWCEGLGNEHSNSLPLCQLERLQSLVNNLYPDKSLWPVPFWIDTICVPSDKEYRRKAILMMSETYEQADRVLVIDNLISHGRIDSPVEETLTRIKFSHWSRRLWTYQEGALANSLHFQLSDGTVRVEDLLNQYNSILWPQLDVYFVRATQIANLDTQGSSTSPDDEDQSAGERVCLDEETTRVLMIQIHRLFTNFHFREGIQSYQRFQRPDQALTDDKTANAIHLVLDALRWRNTSRLEDEAVCLGSVLGVSISKIVEGPNDKAKDSNLRASQRMRRLFLSFEKVPSELLFIPTRRIHGGSNGWIPHSCLGIDDSFYDEGPPAVRHDDGHHVLLPGLELAFLGELPQQTYLTLDLQDGHIYRAVIDHITADTANKDAKILWPEICSSKAQYGLIFSTQVTVEANDSVAILVEIENGSNLPRAIFKAAVLVKRIGNVAEGKISANATGKLRD